MARRSRETPRRQGSTVQPLNIHGRRQLVFQAENVIDMMVPCFDYGCFTLIRTQVINNVYHREQKKFPYLFTGSHKLYVQIESIFYA